MSGIIKSYKDFKASYKADLHRYFGGGHFLRAYFTHPGFKYTYHLRLFQFVNRNKFLILLKPFVIIHLLHFEHKYGIQIPRQTRIGKGFYIGHYGTIIVNGDAIIGDNVNISHGVTIGVSNRGRNKGVPTIGNNVYIGPGAKIIGKINVGNYAAIGANAVVTQDVPDHACVAGVPARIINMEGSEGYVNNIV